MNEKIGYKVVFCDYDDYYKSICAPIGANVKYFLNKWAKSRGRNGPLAVFDNFDFKDMELFGTSYKIFECKYILSKETALWYWCWYHDGSKEKILKTDFPPGTVLADKVMLIKEIKRCIINKEVKNEI
jgi:hypothetical protein